MKKTLLSIFAIMTLAMGMTSCQKEENNNITFQGSMETYTAADDTKTVLIGTDVVWEAADQIKVYGTQGYGIFTATPQYPNNTVADFSKGTANPGEAPYYAFYPVSIANSESNITLPTVQATVNGDLTYFPMFAKSDTTVLTFKNLCGVLKLNLQKENVNISSIQVSVEEGKNINGNFNVRQSGIVPTMTYVANGSNTTTLTCSEAQAIDETKSFFIYMPHGTYTNMEIVITTDDNRTCTKTLKANKSVYIGRSQYTEINLGSENLNF